MKKFLFSFVMILLVTTVVLTGCGKSKGLSDNPATNAQVSGNGGFAVVKGDYLYFVNGYEDDYTATYTSTSDNKFGSVNFGAIYRTKLVNGNVQYNADGTLKNSDVVVSKLVGFENGGFYIFGDYIYYATPLMEKNSSGTLRSDLTNFCRVKVDGTDNKEKLYVTSVEVDKDHWTMFEYDGSAYLVVAETENSATTLKSIAINEKGKTTERTLVDSVTDFVFNAGQNNNYMPQIYFTKALSDSTYSGNQFGVVNATSGEVTLFRASNTTYKPLKFVDGNIYYSATTTIGDGSEKEVLLKYQSVDTPFDTTQAKAVVFGYEEYTEYAVAGYNKNIVAIRNSTTNIIVKVSGVTATHTIEGASKLIGFVGDNLYYLNSSNKLKKVQITADYTQAYESTDAVQSDKSIQTTMFDCNGNNLYLFASYTAENGNSHYYLNKVSNDEARYVGVFASNHALAPLSADADEDEIWVY